MPVRRRDWSDQQGQGGGRTRGTRQTGGGQATELARILGSRNGGAKVRATGDELAIISGTAGDEDSWFVDVQVARPSGGLWFITVTGSGSGFSGDWVADVTGVGRIYGLAGQTLHRTATTWLTYPGPGTIGASVFIPPLGGGPADSLGVTVAAVKVRDI